MSTDKTLADAQPGGRVRLGDRNDALAASLRQIADAQYTRRQRFNGRLPADVQEVIRMAAAALSAQPSPGGQGDQRSDLVPGIVRCAKCQFQLVRSNLNMYDGTVTAGDSKTEPCPNGCGPLWPVTWETWAREGWAEAERLHLENAALSAQPSPGGQGDAPLRVFSAGRWTYDGTGQTFSHEDMDAAAFVVYRDALAARQPVGDAITVEAVATVRRNGDGDRYIDWLTEGGIADLEVGDVLMVSDRAITDEDGSGEVYAAPPAQAVDLGQFRPMVEEFRRNWANYGRTMTAAGKDKSTARQNVDAADRLLALIDKAVGNG